MGDPTTKAAISTRNGTWLAFQASLTRLVEETVRKELAAKPVSNRNLGGVSAELKKTITEAVTGVLIETNFLERLVERQVKACVGASPPANGGAVATGGENPEALRQETEKVVREYLSRHLGVLFQTEIRGVIQKEMKTFLSSDELKELIDEKFRMINHYLKTEVIPKVVHQELSKS
jgi:hypothetical protein